ncbi:MAG: quaternary ammonium compound efflux SMR transporter SugE [Candidatus Zixiibacteriota bacterium]
MAWIYLVVAGIFEVIWAVGLKYAQGFTRLGASAVTVVAMLVSFFFLAQAVKSIPVGTGYAIWTGIGAAGTAFFGIILFAESVSLARLFCIGLIVVGIIGLKLTSN